MRRRCSLPLVLVWTLATVVPTTAVRADNGRCLRANVPAPMVFPDGSVHPAGTLMLCVNDYSPVASYHKVSVNGIPVGFVFSQRRVPERQQSMEPLVLFHKTDDGALRLVGYSLPSGTTVHAYLLQGQPWDARVGTRIPAKETALPLP